MSKTHFELAVIPCPVTIDSFNRKPEACAPARQAHASGLRLNGACVDPCKVSARPHVGPSVVAVAEVAARARTD